MKSHSYLRQLWFWWFQFDPVLIRLLHHLGNCIIGNFFLDNGILSNRIIGNGIGGDNFLIGDSCSFF